MISYTILNHYIDVAEKHRIVIHIEDYGEAAVKFSNYPSDDELYEAVLNVLEIARLSKIRPPPPPEET